MARPNTASHNSHPTKNTETRRRNKLPFRPHSTTRSEGSVHARRSQCGTKSTHVRDREKSSRKHNYSQSSGNERQQSRLHRINIFDTKEIKNLAESTLKHTWAWFTEIGSVISGIIGIYFTVHRIKYITGTILNGIRIHQTVGCSIALIGSIWDSLTALIIHSHQTRKPEEEAMEMDQIAQQETSHPRSQHWTDRSRHINDLVSNSVASVNSRGLGQE